MAPRRLVILLAGLVAGAVAVLLSRLRGEGTGPAEAARRAVARAAPVDAARRAAGRLPGISGWRTDDGPGTEEFTCECGQAYRATGEGRHRVYWVAGADASDPVLDGRCVQCERPLPGEHVAAA